MTESITLFLEMAEFFRMIGDRRMEKECRDTATKICDYLLWCKETAHDGN